MKKKCPNCDYQLPEAAGECPDCGFPCQGDEKQILGYRLALIDVRSWLAEAGKSLRALLSLSYLFLFLLAIAGIYTLWFRQLNIIALTIFAIASAVYYLLYRLSRAKPYPALVLALFFYLIHTLYEFQLGMVPAVAEGASPGKVLGLIARALPFVYVVFRLAVSVVLGRGVWLLAKTRRYQRMADWALRNPEPLS